MDSPSMKQTHLHRYMTCSERVHIGAMPCFVELFHCSIDWELRVGIIHSTTTAYSWSDMFETKCSSSCSRIILHSLVSACFFHWMNSAVLYLETVMWICRWGKDKCYTLSEENSGLWVSYLLYGVSDPWVWCQSGNSPQKGELGNTLVWRIQAGNCKRTLDIDVLQMMSLCHTIVETGYGILNMPLKWTHNDEVVILFKKKKKVFPFLKYQFVSLSMYSYFRHQSPGFMTWMS